MKLPPGHIDGQGVVQATAYGGYGERLLRTMGWGDGQGLGLDGTGIKEAIQVKKKDDTVGIGSKSIWNWEEKWWEKAFDSAVQTLKTADSDFSASDSDSDDDTNHHHAAGKVNRDGTMSSASVDELRLLKHLSKSGSSRVAAGRFGGRDAKLERIRAQEADMAAQAAAKLQGKHHHLKSTPTATNTTNTSTPDSEEKNKKKKKKKESDDDDRQSAENNNNKKQRIVIEPVIQSSIMRQSTFAAFVKTPSSGWWGANMFKSVGCLEGLKDQKNQERGFNEDDQTRIFNAAHAGKTQGKVGLGQGTGTVKVAGMKWEGNKVTFDDDNNGGGGEKKKEKKEEEKKNSNDTEVDSLSSIKWKKLIKQALQTAPDGCLKLKQLQKNMMVHLEKKIISSGDEEKEVKSKVKAIVVETIEKNSKKFALKGKSVQLVSSR
jgi:hypothetical protein